MQVDIALPEGTDVADAAASLDASGRRLWLGETQHDVFLQAMRALQASTQLEVGTSVAVAFARNPMTVAYLANDLSLLSGGRFTLGLGTQVRAHVQRRFGMPWSHPADRMEEYVRALRAIWTAWRTGDRLDFAGTYYRHTLMTPVFTPPTGAADPQVFLAAVGPRMTEVAGRVADGLIAHAFATERYLREITRPRIADAARRAGRDPGGVQLNASVFVVTGDGDLRRQSRQRLAFYGSTPAYRDVLALHGWADLADELARLSRTDARDRWERMGELIDDTVLETFAACGRDATEVAGVIRDRFGDLADRVTLCAAASTDLPQQVAAELDHLACAAGSGAAARALAPPPDEPTGWVGVRDAGAVRVLTLQNTGARNALSSSLVVALHGALLDADADPAVRAVVLTGADPAFCAGVDLKEAAARGADYFAQFDRTNCIAAVGRLSKPVIGAINGAAFTGGLELALGCDLLIASERAVFADTHVRVGVIPGGGMTARLPHLVGSGWARRMSMSGEVVDAATALRIGLVTEVTPHTDLLPRALAVAAAIAEVPPMTMRALKRIYTTAAGLPLAAALETETRIATANPPELDRLEERRRAVMARNRSQLR